MKYCPNCGTSIDPNAKFCSECGAPQTASFCPNCGKQVRPQDKFCTSCGHALTQSSAPVEKNNETQVQFVEPSQEEVSVQNQSIDVALICPHCRSQYSALQEDWDKENIYWQCPNCGERIDGAFCGYCPSHKGYVVFRPYNNKEVLGATVVGAIAGYRNPGETIGNLIGSLFDSTPTAKATGVCPLCMAECMKCPTCNRAVQVTFDNGGVVVCPDCHTRFKMN